MTVPVGAKLKLARAVSASEVHSLWVAGVALSRLLTVAAEREGCMGPGWPLPASAWLTLGVAGVRPVLRRRRCG